MNIGLSAVVAMKVHAVITTNSKQDAAERKRDQPTWRRYCHAQTRRVAAAAAAGDGDATAAVEMLRFGTVYCAGWSVRLVRVLRQDLRCQDWRCSSSSVAFTVGRARVPRDIDG